MKAKLSIALLLSFALAATLRAAGTAPESAHERGRDALNAAVGSSEGLKKDAARLAGLEDILRSGRLPRFPPVMNTTCSLTYNGFGSPAVGRGPNPAEAANDAMNGCQWWQRARGGFTCERCNGNMVCTNDVTGLPVGVPGC